MRIVDLKRFLTWFVEPGEYFGQIGECHGEWVSKLWLRLYSTLSSMCMFIAGRLSQARLAIITVLIVHCVVKHPLHFATP